jgi:hypothetical protein
VGAVSAAKPSSSDRDQGTNQARASGAKPCLRCGGTRGPKYARKRHCGKCDRVVKKEGRDRAHRSRVSKTYGIPIDGYDKLYEAQGGCCYICQRATGKSRRLAVDHDHSCCPELPACGKCVRGLLCGTCNKMVGHSRDQAEFFDRAAEYLRNPPAHTALQER